MVRLSPRRQALEAALAAAYGRGLAAAPCDAPTRAAFVRLFNRRQRFPAIALAARALRDADARGFALDDAAYAELARVLMDAADRDQRDEGDQ